MSRLTFPRVRDALLLAFGLGIIVEETLYASEPRAILIGLAAAMIGLPATWSANKRFTVPAALKPSEPPARPEQPPPPPDSSNGP